MGATPSAIGVTSALYPVLFEATTRVEVGVAFVANVVHIGVTFVLVQGTPMRKASVAAFAVRHGVSGDERDGDGSPCTLR